MKINLITFFLLNVVFSVYSQDTIRHYLNDEFSRTDSSNASFIQEVIRVNGIYKVIDKEISGEIFNYCEYSSLKPLIENGLAIDYIEPGVIYSKGHYLDGKITGIWYYYLGLLFVDTVDYTSATFYDKSLDCHIVAFARENNKTYQDEQNVLMYLRSYLSNEIHIPPRTLAKGDDFNIDINFSIGTDGKINCIEFPNSFDRDLEVELIRLLKLFEFREKIKESLNIRFTYSYKDEVFVIVEDMPTFRGGDLSEFRLYVERNLNYPEQAKINGIQGKVFVQFAVNKNGQVVDVIVVRSVNPLLDAEAIRVIKSSPKWSPGKQRGEPVTVQFTIPIIFDLVNNK